MSTLPVVELSAGWAAVASSAAWAAVASSAAWAGLSVAIGYAAHRLPPARLADDGWLTRLRPWEAGGRVYERRLRIRTWKRWLPEAGDAFAGGFSKAHLRGRDDDLLARFVVETRRAELTHWALLACGPLFLLWTPPWLGVVMVAFGVAANLPCLVAQRYNRARLLRVLAARRARATGSGQR